MANCPNCGKEGKVAKTWSYGPKTRPGPSFDVTIYECSAGHKWRSYERKSIKA